MSKSQILERVWNYDFGGQAHIVELYISYLRKKIDAGRDPLIHTVRGASAISCARRRRDVGIDSDVVAHRNDVFDTGCAVEVCRNA